MSVDGVIITGCRRLPAFLQDCQQKPVAEQ
jgi:hypothetical protein